MKSRGFTLVELLIVIAIIALLSGIIISSLSPSRARARDAKRISDVGQIQLALTLYYDRCKQFPQVLATTAVNGCPPGSVTLGSYMSKIPTTPNGGNYTYTVNSSTTPTDYVVHTVLESKNVATQDGRTDTQGILTPAPPCDTDLNYCLGPK